MDDIVVPDVCTILQIPIYRNITDSKSLKNSPSLDRIIPSKGYVKGNVRVISHKANSHKADMTLEEIERMYKYAKGEI